MKSLEEEEILKNKISIFENKEITNVECASCETRMFDIDILEKLIEETTSNKSFENSTFEKKALNKNMYASKNKIKSKRNHRVWVEKGTTYSRNLNVVTCFYCMKKGSYLKYV